MVVGFERRLAEWRKRPPAERLGRDRRQAHRHAAAGVALALGLLVVGARTAQADLYARINSRGVLEATDCPAGAHAQDFRLAYRSKGTLVHSAGFRLRASSNSEFDAHIDAAASLHGVSRELVRAIIQVESAFDRRAVSTAGARGLMQLMPATARRLGVSDSFDPRQNIFAGTRYLRLLLDTYLGDVSLAAAAYNAGEDAVARYGGIPPFRETKDYVRKVRALLGMTQGAPVAVVPASAASVPVVKPPRVYYRWKGANGVVHMAQAPPASGEFITIRSTD